MIKRHNLIKLIVKLINCLMYKVFHAILYPFFWGGGLILWHPLAIIGQLQKKIGIHLNAMAWVMV